MKVIRATALVLATTAALVLAPVVGPVWAAPHPVKPTVHRTPLTGVDDAALRGAPTSTPSATGGAGSSAARAGAPRPAVFTRPFDTGRFTAAGVSWRNSGDPASSRTSETWSRTASWVPSFRMNRFSI